MTRSPRTLRLELDGTLPKPEGGQPAHLGRFLHSSAMEVSPAWSEPGPRVGGADLEQQGLQAFQIQPLAEKHLFFSQGVSVWYPQLVYFNIM